MRHPDKSRLAELLLYISEKCADDPNFGATKLNKILFYSDFLAFAMLGDSITGYSYQKLQHGPVPRGVNNIRGELEQSGAAHVEEVPVFGGKTQSRTVPNRSAVLGSFTAEEIGLVDRVLESLRSTNAKTVSELSHIEIGWQVAKKGETIPYGTIFLSDKPLTNDEVRRIQHFAEQHGYSTS
jgi:uncharacterized phage-associated protein